MYIILCFCLDLILVRNINKCEYQNTVFFPHWSKLIQHDSTKSFHSESEEIITLKDVSGYVCNWEMLRYAFTLWECFCVSRCLKQKIQSWRNGTSILTFKADKQQIYTRLYMININPKGPDKKWHLSCSGESNGRGEKAWRITRWMAKDGTFGTYPGLDLILLNWFHTCFTMQ